MDTRPALDEREEVQNLPVIETKTTPIPSYDGSAKDSTAPISSPTPTEITPTRTVSTLVQEPDPVVTKRSPPTAPVPGESRPVRPGLPRRRTTAQTRYIDMLLELDTISRFDNLGAAVFTWILLAGYIVFPATFQRLESKVEDGLPKDPNDPNVEKFARKHLLNAVEQKPLLYVAACACGVGVFGCLWLWWRHRRNYVWVINRVFLPALMNSIAGVISTMVGIYGAQKGQLSITAKVTIIVTGACTVVATALFLIYNSIMLAMTKRKHERETREVQESLFNSETLIEQQTEKRGQLAKERFGHHETLGVDPGRVV